MSSVLENVWNLEVGQTTAWNNIRGNFAAGDEEWMYTAVLVIAHSATFYFINTLYLILDVFFQKFVERFRFQPYKHPPRELVVQCIAYVTCFHVVASFAMYYLAPLAVQSHPTMFTMPVPGLGKLLAQLVLCYVTTDCLFYWGHRMLHLKFFYQRVHKQHHQFRQSIGFACEYAHPFELVVGNIIPVIAGPVVFKLHFFVFAVWMTIAILGTSWGHSGFTYPIAMTGGRHDFHHSHNVGNFGSLPFWDWAMGTDRAWREFMARGEAEAKVQRADTAADAGSSPPKEVAGTPRVRRAPSASTKPGPKKRNKSRSVSSRR